MVHGVSEGGVAEGGALARCMVSLYPIISNSRRLTTVTSASGSMRVGMKWITDPIPASSGRPKTVRAEILLSGLKT